jgi:hypothetical protein
VQALYTEWSLALPRIYAEMNLPLQILPDGSSLAVVSFDPFKVIDADCIRLRYETHTHSEILCNVPLFSEGHIT